MSYLDAAGKEIHADANELHIPLGRPVVVDMVSEDVIHSFWVPKLGGKMDMIPGRTNRVSCKPTRRASTAGNAPSSAAGRIR